MFLFTKINLPSEFIKTSSWLTSRFFINYGYQEDGPGDDLLYSNSHLANMPLIKNPSLKKYFKIISSQYNLSSCTANAVADAFEAQIAHKEKIDPLQVKDLSRLFIYWNARNLNTPPNAYKDSGSKIRFAFDSIARYGVPNEDIYPYISSKVNDRPTILAYRMAIRNRIDKFYRIDKTGNERLTQIKQALSANCPVVFGTKISNSFKHVNNDSVIIVNPRENWVGSHAMVIVSWSEERQSFEIRNSWGEGWGTKGYGWMHKSYIASNITRDLWVPTI